MTEWGIVTSLITLVGLLTAIVTPMIRLNSTIVKLTSQVDSLLNGLSEFKARYSSHLAELNAMDERQNSKLEDHEHRITVLESK